MNFYIVLAIFVVLILSIVSLCLGISNNSKLNELLEETPDGDLLDSVKKYFKKVRDIEARMSIKTDEALVGRIEVLERDNKINFKKSALVNFDAFDDVSGTLSFALTLLDENNNGYIITSLYGHNSCNTYVRVVEGGITQAKLLDEEVQSLEKAKGGTLNDTK